ncbi:hypothetical protein FA95DRAFT_1568152 [Auriscalpium vulgare]|uniref:Uncharacterized protein n=1 Tax=Auriscalpium vulgare TaxID=40419 RepID=A0ACB8R0F6_9AGAM|nr:hypothetical protein FA95DRAFT_1568152 [Auriscalpium vulgare]
MTTAHSLPVPRRVVLTVSRSHADKGWLAETVTVVGAVAVVLKSAPSIKCAKVSQNNTISRVTASSSTLPRRLLDISLACRTSCGAQLLRLQDSCAERRYAILRTEVHCAPV